MAIPEWRWLVFLCLLRVRCEAGELIQADTCPSPFALAQTYQSPARGLPTTYQPPAPVLPAFIVYSRSVERNVDIPTTRENYMDKNFLASCQNIVQPFPSVCCTERGCRQYNHHKPGTKQISTRRDVLKIRIPMRNKVGLHTKNSPGRSALAVVMVARLS